MLHRQIFGHLLGSKKTKRLLMAARLSTGWCAAPLDASRTRQWDGAAWAGQSTESDPFTSPAAPPEPRLPYSSPPVVDAFPPRIRGRSIGGVVGIGVSIVVAATALHGALVALNLMTSSSQDTADSE